MNSGNTQSFKLFVRSEFIVIKKDINIPMTLLYLDPGTGSLMIQFVIAAVTGVLIFFKQIKLRIKYLFNRFFKSNKEGDE